MNIREIISAKKLEHAVNREYCIVYCTTSWSIPCGNQYSLLAELAENYISWDAIIKVDIEKYPDAATALNIQSIPTTILFCSGKEAGRIVGFRSFETFHTALKKMWPAGFSNSNLRQDMHHDR